MKLHLQKTPDGLLRPVDDETVEALSSVKMGDILHADFKRMRNYKFHRKWFALVKYAFEHWEPAQLQAAKWVDVTPEKSLDRFRKDLTIMAGHYDASYRLDGSVRIEAKSISFGKMSEEEFNSLYSNTIDAVLKHVLVNYEKAELEGVIDQVLGFAG